MADQDRPEPQTTTETPDEEFETRGEAPREAVERKEKIAEQRERADEAAEQVQEHDRLGRETS